MKILGIETSCDETAVGIVEDGRRLLASEVASSMDLHIKYGGVVPEVAARSHIEVITPVIDASLKSAKLSWQDIDGIAVTYGAGLGGSLLIGVMAARTLSIALDKPLYGANHVMGHVFANFINSSSLGGYVLPEAAPEFPMLALIISGGHTQLAIFNDYFNYQLLGVTLDDAVGEAFDKVSKLLGLGYPGGPAISITAEKGNSSEYKFPFAKVGKYDFSFSGLKTAVLRQAQSVVGEDFSFPSVKLPGRLSDAQKANIAASFQYAAIKTLVDKALEAIREFKPKCLVLAGGVAANSELRKQLSSSVDIPLLYPDIKLCTDNGAMIAALGCYMKIENMPLADPFKLAIEPNLKM